MVNNHRIWITRLLPWLLSAAAWSAGPPASAQDRLATVVTPATGSGAVAVRGAASKTPASPEKPVAQAEDLTAEFKELLDVQTGLVLTLAACGDEPHCVSGINEQELNRMQERLQKATKQLEQEAPEKKGELLKELQALRDGADRLQASVAKVETEIDRTQLEGNWSDQFVFDDFNVGPQVPFPNEKVPLVRFEDAEQPLPLE